MELEYSVFCSGKTVQVYKLSVHKKARDSSAKGLVMDYRIGWLPQYCRRVINQQEPVLS